MKFFLFLPLAFIIETFAARVIYTTRYKWRGATIPIVSHGRIPDSKIDLVVANMDRWSNYRYVVSHTIKCRGKVHIITIRGPGPLGSRALGNGVIEEMKDIMQQHIRGTNNNVPPPPGDPEDPPCPTDVSLTRFVLHSKELVGHSVFPRATSPED
ncbi:hypothetical protein K461DRAFT_293902 [Myriangium duriaei CBS 260.36]|uniref:Uncharacterized protein n=1 Tax=Myriangium duriaei CBS 260.36 TaxID=1168546 RepID=A0A9P4MGI7_9PEZI|nr:hypothetical protein K461DRAFT_293902 [Myriangium duriaei CBS 260.36]